MREYALIRRISPPTASKLLSQYYKEGILRRTRYKNYLLFYANHQSRVFIDLSRMYWRDRLIGLVSALEKKLNNPTIVLFGSLSKGEAKSDSDIDLAIFAQKKDFDYLVFERKIKRKIQVFWFKSVRDVKNVNLLNSFINGYLLSGRFSVYGS